MENKARLALAAALLGSDRSRAVERFSARLAVEKSIGIQLGGMDSVAWPD